MVTGDNIHTAQHIAKECGILSEDGIALEGPDFRVMPEDKLLPLLPKLQVAVPDTSAIDNLADRSAPSTLSYCASRRLSFTPGFQLVFHQKFC